MRGLAAGAEGARSPLVRAAALAITRQVANRDHAGIRAAVFAWVKRSIAFRGEPGELVQSPEVTLRQRAGDCDDHATLLAALLGALGYKTRFVTVASSPAAPREFTHVYVEAQEKLTRQWVPLDTTEAKSYPGWSAPRVYRTGRWRSLGDAAVYAPPLTPGQAFAYNLARTFATPLVNAEAQRIAYPGGTALFAGPGAVGVNFSKIAGWGLAIGATLLVIHELRGGRR